MSGAERSLLLLLARLRDRYECLVACPARGPLAENIRSLGLATAPMPGVRTAGRGKLAARLRLVATSIRLWRILGRLQPDIVHANNLNALAATAIPARLRGVPLVFHARDLPRVNAPCRFVVGCCKRAIAVSRSVADRLGELGLRGEAIRVVYNGVEADSGELGREARHGRNGPVFVNVGQFVAWKRQDVFLRAAARVSRRLPEARFLLVGDDIFGREGHYKRGLLLLAERLRLRERLRICGWISDMRAIWREATCLVHTAEGEPFGRVLIEAMQAGVPVIAVDSAGPSEIVESGVNGLLVPPRDVDTLTEAMIRIASDEAAATRMADRARADVRRRFSAQRTADGVQDVFEECLRIARG